MHLFSFSTPFLATHSYKQEKNLLMQEPAIVFNAGLTSLLSAHERISPRTSTILQNETIPLAEDAVIITSTHGFSALNRFPDREELMKIWTHVHDIFPLPHLLQTNLWRSPKEQIGNVAYNLWFAAEGTNCGIHNEHNFLEVHTQIWGTGHMQKFHEKNVETLYQDIFMTPGFTHEPFCGADHTYPWHRYFADTDCIWLAVEYYD